MLMRGCIELWMLYVTKNWSPLYGIAHDMICLTTLLAFNIANRKMTFDLLHKIVYFHAWVMTLLFLPEMYFAWYMKTHFITAGEKPIYFVPNDAQYHDVLFVTKMIVLSLNLYLPFFLVKWLYASPTSNS
jgi:hypothetical protein